MHNMFIDYYFRRKKEVSFYLLVYLQSTRLLNKLCTDFDEFWMGAAWSREPDSYVY